ncbi:MAG: tryptophan--tRNA ligase [Desulfobacterales bacterium]|nr:MAG: tryptophan--tRNA ligase [Desulfobacterales bacterium]
MNRIALSGIKPTGTPHIGNYLGMIKPALALVENYQTYYFIADYHALTTTHDRKTLNHQVYEIAATLLALGLDAERVVFYRQSDIPEIFELTWILNCFTSKGLLNRAHAYKAIVDENIKEGKNPDDSVNAGLFNYPVLMAADILLFGTHVVPVGQDQKQHVEIARDIAIAINSNYGQILTVPEPLIQATVMTIPGLDGRKMSKNYQNTIPVFADPKLVRKQVMRIVTDSKRPEDPKDPEACNVFAIYKYFASPASMEARRNQYRQGGLAYSAIKQELCELLEDHFATRRTTYRSLMNDPDQIDRVLRRGAEKARAAATPLMEKLRRKIGIRR